MSVGDLGRWRRHFSGLSLKWLGGRLSKHLGTGFGPHEEVAVVVPSGEGSRTHR